MGYCRVLFETGLTFLNSLLKNKLINNLYVFQSNNLLNNYGKNNSSPEFLKKIKISKKIKVNLNNANIYKKNFNYV